MIATIMVINNSKVKDILHYKKLNCIKRIKLIDSLKIIFYIRRYAASIIIYTKVPIIKTVDRIGHDCLVEVFSLGFMDGILHTCDLNI